MLSLCIVMIVNITLSLGNYNTKLPTCKPYKNILGHINDFKSSIDWKKFVGLLFYVNRHFETVFHSISGRLPERARKKREMTIPGW